MRLGTFSAMALATQKSLAATIFATSYSGTVDTVSLTRSNGWGNYTLDHAASITACGGMPSWLTLDKAGGVLYCANEAVAGSLTAFAIQSNGTLAQTAVASTIGGDVNSHLYGGKDGKGFIVLAEYETASVSTFALPLSSASKPLQALTYNLTQPGPVPSRQEAPHPHQATLDPSGKFVLVPDLGADLIRLYAVDNATGMLTPMADYVAPPGSGPRHLTFYQPTAGSYKGVVMYLASELSNSLTAFAVSYPSSGGIEFNVTQGPVHTYPGGNAPNGSAVAEVQVMGQTLTVSNRGDQSFGANMDSLAVFSLARNGSFAFQNIYPSGGSYPRTFRINKAGDLAVVGDQDSDTVVVLQRNATTGALGAAVGSVTLGGQVSSVIWDE